MLTPSSIKYVWSFIREVSGIPSELPINLIYGDFQLKEGDNGISVNVFRARNSQWEVLIDQAKKSVFWIKTENILPKGETTQISVEIPIFFKNPYVERNHLITYISENHILEINFDILGICFFMLSRWEEIINDTRDNHGRFPVKNSVAYQVGFLEQPIVDEIAIILGKWIKVTHSNIKLNNSQFRVQISHDIDHLNKKGNSVVKFLSLIKDYYTNPDFHIIWEDFKHIWKGHGIYPYFWSAQELVKWANHMSYKPFFYLMSSEKSKFNEGYNPNFLGFADFIKAVKNSGFSIGLHAGYDTMLDSDLMAAEKQKLEKAADVKIDNVRQHYLRLDIPTTWRIWAKVGLIHDSSMGYSEASGFRCGTCHPFKLFDIGNNVILPVIEEPLIVMDVTLFGYKKFNRDTGIRKIFELAKKCQAVGGIFSLLWHNTSIIHTQQRWGEDYYHFVSKLLNEEF